MLIYLYNAISMPIYGLLIKNKKKYITISCIQMFIILAFRSENVGYDYKNYQEIFDHIASIASFGDLFHRLDFIRYANIGYKIESGWVLLNWLPAKAGLNYRFVMIVYAAFVMWTIGCFVYKYSYKPWLSLFLFTTIGSYEICFTPVRQTTATAILLWSFLFVEERKYYKAVGCALIAYAFHHTAIIFIGLILLSKIKVTKQRMGIWTLAVLVYAFMSPILYDRLIYPFISVIGYQSTINQGYRINNLFILLISIELFLLVFSKNSFYEIRANGLLFWGYGLTLLLEAVGLNSNGVARSIYMTFIYFICLLPNVFYYYKTNKSEEGIMLLVNRQNARLLTICSVVLFMLFLSYKLVDSALVPYEFSVL